ncbi:myb-related transcription factor, partial [Trifolium medium]|nr:myb-related transcription factor [Trifolium medium]
RDIVQKAINEGCLKFDEKSKPQMKIDSDPLQVTEASYIEPFECLVVEAMEATTMQAVTEEEYVEKIKVVYPQAE